MTVSASAQDLVIVVPQTGGALVLPDTASLGLALDLKVETHPVIPQAILHRLMDVTASGNAALLIDASDTFIQEVSAQSGLDARLMPLGVGPTTGDPGPRTLVVPQDRKITLRVRQAALFGGSSDLADSIMAWLYQSSDGAQFRSRLTFLPLVPGEPPHFDGDSAVRAGAEANGDDDCGCDDGMLQSCDPDTGLSEPLSLELADVGQGGAIQFSPPGLIQDDDPPDCGCDEGRILFPDLARERAGQLRNDAEGREPADALERLVAEAEVIASALGMIGIMTCDPD